MKKSIFKILLMVTGLWHILVFFLIPYAKLEGLMSSLGQLAGALGAGEAYPEKLTGLSAVKMASMFGSDSGLLLVMFVAPVVLGAIILLLNLISKGKAGYVLTMILSVVMLAFYGLAIIGLQDYAQIGYSTGATVYICLVICVAQFIISIIGLVKDKGQASAPKAAGKDVKVSKKDGTITGVRGSYSGAVIPVKSGDTIIIGRDPAVCSIVVKDEKASRKHCEIAFNGDNGMYAVTDYSVNGVYDRDGNRIAEKVAVPMTAGSEIRIGKDGDIFRLG